jgi:2-polyprenyl-3-methyl-5-hydroxy-6-metoxy-1,4-benzoquinol methylase
VSLTLTPARRRGVEVIDNPAVDPALIMRSLEDVERANCLFGGSRSAIAELEPALDALPKSATLLDVGTGTGDIPVAAREAAARRGVSLTTIGLDVSPALVTRHRERNTHVVVADALRLPFRDRSIDVVLGSQLLHHFDGARAAMLLREMDRVARVRVVISDLRRSRAAAFGFWIASFVFGFHPVTRHDGVLSVFRGFLPDELADLLQVATGERPRVSRRPLFRVTTSWVPRT